MKKEIGVIIPVLNAADNLDILLNQLKCIDKIIIIEYVDNFMDQSEYNVDTFASIDSTRTIAESFSNVVFSNIGKVDDVTYAINRGIHYLASYEKVLILRQYDFIVDLDKILIELEINKVITTKRLMLLNVFNKMFLDDDSVIGINKFSNVKFVNEYSVNPKDYLSKECFDIIINNSFATSKSKSKKNYVRYLKNKKYFSNGILAAKNLNNDSIVYPKTKSNTIKINHPWINKNEKFFESLNSFPELLTTSIIIDNYTPTVNKTFDKKVFAFNDKDVLEYFESEGWNIDDNNVEYDLMYSINKIPNMDIVTNKLKKNGRLILLDIEKYEDDNRFDIVHYEKNISGLFTYVITKI